MVPVLALWALLGDPGECSSALAAARREYEQRRFDAAVVQFESAHAVCSQPSVTLLPLAQAQLMAQKFDASLRSLDALIGMQPKHTDALKLRGDVLYLVGRQQEAEKSMQAALEADPAHSASQYALGRIYYQQNRFPEAIKLLASLVEREPSNYRAHDNLALCYVAVKQDADAMRHFKQALALVAKDHPEYDTVYANVARYFLDRADFEKAFQFGAEAAKRNPQSARNFFLTGKALAQLNKHELSVRWFEQAAQLDPTYTEPHYWLANVYRKLGRKDESNRSLAKFRELSKNPKVSR